jgi:large subunit GTPase 1
MKKGKKNVLSKLVKEVNSRGVSHKAAVENKHSVQHIETNKNMKSVLEAKNLDEYMDLIRLGKSKMEVENEQTVMMNINNVYKDITANQSSNIFLSNVLKNTDIVVQHIKPLVIPKKPKWKEGMNKVEYEKLEREAFLNWRKALAEEEEKQLNFAITPFEKNIEVWKQLWLVVDKCQILVIIVDGRNPLYFICPDLENYIRDIGPEKEYLILVNKSDLLNESVRKHWSQYFKENNINYIFFSALEEIVKIEQEETIIPKELNDYEDENDDEIIENEFKGLNINKEDEEEIQPKEPKLIKEHAKVNVEATEEIRKENKVAEIICDPKMPDPDIKIFNREELIAILKEKSKSKKKSTHNTYNIGFIGYPNVGKSSVINVLMKKKRVGVALMPGKTKHYQSLYLPDEENYLLMDCPGLVFPSFTSSKSDMLVNGILPIDTLRDYHEAISIIIKRIPRKVLEHIYKIQLPDIYSAKQFLQAIATKRGYYTGSALPDEAKTAKQILKDYVSGKLLYCILRPDYNEEKYGKIINYQDIVELDEEEEEKQNMIKEIPADYDENYEKINIITDNKKVVENDDDVDRFFFDPKKDIKPELKITKDIQRVIKFALKRGDVTFI